MQCAQTFATSEVIERRVSNKTVHGVRTILRNLLWEFARLPADQDLRTMAVSASYCSGTEQSDENQLIDLLLRRPPAGRTNTRVDHDNQRIHDLSCTVQYLVDDVEKRQEERDPGLTERYGRLTKPCHRIVVRSMYVCLGFCRLNLFAAIKFSGEAFADSGR